MLVNEYGIGKIKFELKISIYLIRNKTDLECIEVWASGNMMICRLEGQWFLSQGGIFFFKVKKLLGDNQTEFVKSLSKIHGNELSNK